MVSTALTFLPAAVFAHDLSLGEDMALHCLFELRLGGSGREPSPGVEGVELEEIPMRAAGWARTGIADAARVVCPLFGATRERSQGGDVFGQ